MSSPRPEIYSRDHYRCIPEIEVDYCWHRGMRAIQAALLASCPGERPLPPGLRRDLSLRTGAPRPAASRRHPERP